VDDAPGVLVMAFFSACTGKRLDLATFMLCPLLGGFTLRPICFAYIPAATHPRGERLAAELPWNREQPQGLNPRFFPRSEQVAT